MNSLIKSAIICGMTEAIRLTRHGQSRGGKSALVQMDQAQDQAQVMVTVYKCTQYSDKFNGGFSHIWMVEGNKVLNPTGSTDREREIKHGRPCLLRADHNGSRMAVMPLPITGRMVRGECPAGLTMTKGTGRCYEVLPAVAAPVAVAAPEAVAAPVAVAVSEAVAAPAAVDAPVAVAAPVAAAVPEAVAAPVAVAVPEANVFAVGQPVRCSKNGKEWLKGEVTSVSPLEVMPHKFSRGFRWHFVQHLQGNAKDVEISGFKIANIGKVPKLNDQVLVEVNQMWRIGTVTQDDTHVAQQREMVQGGSLFHDGGILVTFANGNSRQWFTTSGFHTIVVDVEESEIASIVAKVPDHDLQAAREAARVHAEGPADKEGAKQKEANQK